jgi:ATP-dependent DNA ligase
VASFNLVRYRHHDERVFVYAFDLIELNGDDLRPDPLESRKATLEMMLAKAERGIRFNEQRLALSQRPLARLAQIKKSDATSGLSKAPTVEREAEEDWGKQRWR